MIEVHVNKEEMLSRRFRGFLPNLRIFVPENISKSTIIRYKAVTPNCSGLLLVPLASGKVYDLLERYQESSSDDFLLGYCKAPEAKIKQRLARHEGHNRDHDVPSGEKTFGSLLQFLPLES